MLHAYCYADSSTTSFYQQLRTFQCHPETTGPRLRQQPGEVPEDELQLQLLPTVNSAGRLKNRGGGVISSNGFGTEPPGVRSHAGLWVHSRPRCCICRAGGDVLVRKAVQALPRAFRVRIDK